MRYVRFIVYMCGERNALLILMKNVRVHVMTYLGLKNNCTPLTRSECSRYFAALHVPTRGRGLRSVIALLGTIPLVIAHRYILISHFDSHTNTHSYIEGHSLDRTHFSHAFLSLSLTHTQLPTCCLIAMVTRRAILSVQPHTVHTWKPTHIQDSTEYCAHTHTEREMTQTVVLRQHKAITESSQFLIRFCFFI